MEAFSSLIFSYFWQIIKAWWWLPLVFISGKLFLFFWLWWRRERWLMTVYKPILLEIKIPKEIVKPVRAMEDVIMSLHQVVYHPPDWWEKWIDGQLQTSISFEIASIEEKIHFYIRIHKDYRDSVEASIYAQFPEAEITQVEDYTKTVPHDIPNKDWDMWATDYRLLKENSYPILTYKKFEREEEEIEEKKVDPIATLFEALAKIKPGEQFWIQMTAMPVTQDESKWIEEGKAIRDKLAHRPEKAKPRPMVWEAAEILITGKPPGVEEKKEEKPMELIAPELRLTPGEREIVLGVEEKIARPGFLTNIRFIYLGKRDIFFRANFRLGFSFFGSYTTQNLNALVPHGPTLTKIHKHWFLPINLIRARRHYLRCRKIFRLYRERFDPLFPRTTPWPIRFILNTEEIASLYHFPSWEAAPVPTVPRIEAKKGPPPEIPTE